MASIVRAASAKVVCPVPGPGFRPLERVRKVLAEQPRVWVEAPSGFGKTCHLAHFARERMAHDGTPYAWLTLDPGDRDPITLVQDLTAAVARAWPGLTVPLNPRVRLSAAGWYAMGQHLAAMLEPLGPFLILLDDVHRLGADASDASALLEGFVQGAAPDVRLMLGGREAPPGLPVGRWQGEGRMARVGAADLRLDSADVRRLIGSERSRTVPELAARLAEATGGWPLLVRLAAQHLASRPPGQWDLDALLAQGQELYHYLAGQIFGQAAPEEQRYLMALSLPEQVDPGVAEALLPEAEQPLYQRLVRPPWFIALAADGVPSRLHPLLRAFLRREAARRLGPAAVRALSLALATYLVAHRQAATALDHAIAAEAWDIALSLLDRVVPEQLAMGRGARVRDWLDALTAVGRDDSAPLLLARARLAALDEDHALAFRLAEAARHRYAAVGDEDGAVACLELYACDLELEPTPEVLSAERAARRDGPAAVAAWAGLWLLKLETARGRSPGTRAIASAVRAVELARPLDPASDRARILADHLRYLAGAVGAIRCTAAQVVEGLSGQMFDYWPALLYAGRWEELATLLEEARGIAVPVWARDFVRAWLEVPRAVLLALGGEASRGLELVESLEGALPPAAALGPGWPLELTVLRAVRTGLLARTGRLEEAERTARANQAALSRSPTMAPVAHLDLAQVLLCRGRALEAEAELDAAAVLAHERGLRGMYYRTLRLALALESLPAEEGRAALVELLGEVERAGAYGLWPVYDPGPIRPALEGLDDASLPRVLSAALRRVRRLYRQGTAPSAAAVLAPAQAVGLETLGRLAWRGGDDEPALPSRRVVELLLRLLWSEGATVSRPTLAETIWPETEPTDQMNRLRVTLHGLRRWLEAVAGAGGGGPAASLVADRTSVRLEGSEALDWDVAHMREQMRQARASYAAGEREAVVRHARAALELYGGPFLPDPVWYEPFLYEREELQRAHTAFAEWTASALGLESPDVPSLMERAVRASPGEEGLHRLWLESLVRQGRMAEARRALRECAAHLEAQVGMELPEEWIQLVHGRRR